MFAINFFSHGIKNFSESIFRKGCSFFEIGFPKKSFGNCVCSFLFFFFRKQILKLMGARRKWCGAEIKCLNYVLHSIGPIWVEICFRFSLNIIIRFNSFVLLSPNFEDIFQCIILKVETKFVITQFIMHVNYIYWSFGWNLQ